MTNSSHLRFAEGLPATVAALSGPSPKPTANYVVLTTDTGTGFSRMGDTMLTTWQGDRATGLRFHIRDLSEGKSWLVGRSETDEAGLQSGRWSPGIFTQEHTNNSLKVTIEACVMSDRPAELRRVTLVNLSDTTRQLDITSVAEVVLNQTAAHAAHPSFSKLFLQTEFRKDQRTLLVSRRPRDPQENHLTLAHAILEPGAVEFETDRARFFGRGRHPGRPSALESTDPLSGTVGNVLDPVVCLRRRISLGAQQMVAVTFLLGGAKDTKSALSLTRSLQRPEDIEAAFTAAATAAEHHRIRLGVSPAEQSYAHHLAAAIFRNEPTLRTAPEKFAKASGDLIALAHLGVSPNQAIALAQHGNGNTGPLLKIQKVWHALDLPIQLVLVSDDESAKRPKPGLIPISHNSLTAAETDLLVSNAAWVVDDTLPDPTHLTATGAACPPETNIPGPPPSTPDLPDLQFNNGMGGFSPDGHEYVIHVAADAQGHLRVPPQPWTNVLANQKLGCIVSETGAGVVWGGNSREHRLTPWFNDPLLDPHGDALYLRDDETCTRFTCLPGPIPSGGSYEIRHGHGYTRCRRSGDDLTTETLIFVDQDSPVRLSRLRITNSGTKARHLSVFSYAHLVLGGLESESSRFVQTQYDEKTGALLANNPTAGPFANHVAFATILSPEAQTTTQYSGNRRTFLGACMDPSAPAALLSPKLDNQVGAGLDPCFALQVSLDLAPGQTVDLWALLGQEETTDQARNLVKALSQPGACESAWHTTRNFWRQGLDGVQVQTPSAALDLMVNGWLGYQTLACRMHGRSALYQSGGAYGFRDQLQDSLALLPLWPHRTRQQILLHAAHQFVEGDVLHWWHQPLDQGIRTRFADDLLWLPYATVAYIKTTGDGDILNESVPFLTAQALEPGQDEVFLQPELSGETADLYNHCCRALDRSLTHGVHGLPLFGTGDWNDGMNRVGRRGQGESVWMGFFLVTIIDGFLPLCQRQNDLARAKRYQAYRDEMVHTLNESGWDGDWYRRGYYDDGSPLGSWENKECAIDALAQAWSVLSGVASPARADQAMDAVEEHLISDDDRLIRLLTPPFVDTPHDPGYIKGYVAGIRENGGQYTHAALWVVRAMATLGRRQRAAALLDLLNPVLNAATPEQVARYQVEPYVMAADVYGAAPHVGRGGWTWYTGSCGWMLQVALESILGMKAQGDTLVMTPCVPDDWPTYSLSWRVPDLSPTADSTGPAAETRYEIRVTNPDGCSQSVTAVVFDDQAVKPVAGTGRIPLLRDGKTHQVFITLGTHPESLS